MTVALPTKDRFFTTSEAARELRVSEATVRRLASVGALRAERIVGGNGTRLYPGDEILRLKEQRQSRPSGRQG